MPVPLAVTKVNKKFTNKALIHLAGHGSFVELEHVGRSSGKTYRIPVNAFRQGDQVTIVLTYGPKVDWYRNVMAAAGCRVRLGRQWLTLGAPVKRPVSEVVDRLPMAARPILALARVTDAVEFTVLSETPA